MLDETLQIDARDVSVRYDDHLAVDGFDLMIDKRLITTIIGPNGSGKSTALKGLTGMLRICQGIVTLDGRDMRKFSGKELSRRIGVLPQKHTAPADFRVKELVSYGRMPYQRMLSGLTREDRDIVDWAMRVTGVYDMRDKSIYEISGGESQRVWIATALAQKPEILFLDEPTTYLDVAHQLELMKLIRKLNRETGVGIVMVLHDVSHAMEISDRVVIIKDGKKYNEGRPEDVITREMMMDVYGVDCAIVRVDGRKRPMIAFAEIG